MDTEKSIKLDFKLRNIHLYSCKLKKCLFFLVIVLCLENIQLTQAVYFVC